MPKIEALALYGAIRQIVRRPEMAGQILLMAGAMVSGIYFCRRYVFTFVSTHFPRVTAFTGKIGTLAGFVMLIFFAAGAIVLVCGIEMFFYNLSSDIAARM